MKPFIFLLLFTALLGAGFVLVSEEEQAHAQPPIGPIPAFPEAEGFGALALNDCDRTDIKVIEVTNLNSDGLGSFRDAIQNQLRDDKLDIIIFRTGGTIDGGGNRIENSCVYIAGQTAPGDGIQLRGTGAVGIGYVRRGEAHDIVVRYLRLRAPKGTPGTVDVMTILGGHDVILDHLSIQWGSDAGLDIWPFLTEGGGEDIHDITFQRSFISEGLKPHSTGMLIGNDYKAEVAGEPARPLTYQISGHHNIFAHNSHRNPNISAMKVQWANNIIYNFNAGIQGSRGWSETDYVNNSYTRGPWTKGGSWIEHRASVRSGGGRVLAGPKHLHKWQHIWLRRHSRRHSKC